VEWKRKGSTWKQAWYKVWPFARAHSTGRDRHPSSKEGPTPSLVCSLQNSYQKQQHRLNSTIQEAGFVIGVNRKRNILEVLSSVTVQPTACDTSFPVFLCAPRRFGGTFRLHHLVDTDYEDTSFLWNFNSHLPDHTAPPPVRRLLSLFTDLHVIVDNTSSTMCSVTSLTDVLNEFQNTEIQPGAYRICCIIWNLLKWQHKMLKWQHKIFVRSILCKFTQITGGGDRDPCGDIWSRHPTRTIARTIRNVILASPLWEGGGWTITGREGLLPFRLTGEWERWPLDRQKAFEQNYKFVMEGNEV
jgi:hypothetical protein